MVCVTKHYGGIESPVSLLRKSHPPRGSVLGSTFYVPKASILNAIPSLKTTLTLSLQNSYNGSKEESYPLWSETEDYFYIPRMVGISIFGGSDIDSRAPGEKMNGVKFVGSLYDWQEEVVEHTLNQLRGSLYNGGILNADCGLGKTMMGIYIAYALGVRVAICVNKEFLMTQWKERIEQVTEGATIGKVQGDSFSIGDFTLVMIQTIISGRYDSSQFDSVGLLMIDEVHHLPAKTYKLTNSYFNAKYCLGLSATLKRGDGNEHAIFWQVGPTLVSCKRNDDALSSMGTVYSIVHTGRGPAQHPERHGRMDWSRLITMLTVDQRRNEIISDKCKSLVDSGYNVLVISERVNHLEALMDLWNDHATHCKYVGETSVKKKRKREELFEVAKLVWTTKAMASEGFDWPPCNCVVLATPTPATANLEQSVGRCQRDHPDKDKTKPNIVVLLVDNTPCLKSISRTVCTWFASKSIKEL